MADDIRENAMAGGTPARLRGLDKNGNSISPTLTEVMEAFQLFTGGISVPAKGMAKITTRRGLFVFQVSYKPGIVVASFGNSLKLKEISNDTDGGILINNDTSSYINIKRENYEYISIYNNHTETTYLSFACIGV